MLNRLLRLAPIVEIIWIYTQSVMISIPLATRSKEFPVVPINF